MDFLSLITAVPTLMSQFSGKNVDPYKKKKEELAAAMGDTNNPLYKQLYGQYKTSGQRSLGSGIAELQRQNRMSNRMGRTPLLSQERGGEDIFRNLMRGYEDVDTNANTQAMGNLSQQLGAYTGMTPTAAQAEQQKLMGFGNIENLLRGTSIKSQYQQPSLDDYFRRLLRA